MRHSSHCQHHLNISLNVTSLKVTISSSSRNWCWVNKTVFKVTCMCRMRKMLDVQHLLLLQLSTKYRLVWFGWISNFYSTIVYCTIRLRNCILLTLYSVFQRWHTAWQMDRHTGMKMFLSFSHRNHFKYILAPQANNVSYAIESLKVHLGLLTFITKRKTKRPDIDIGNDTKRKLFFSIPHFLPPAEIKWSCYIFSVITHQIIVRIW